MGFEFLFMSLVPVGKRLALQTEYAMRGWAPLRGKKLPKTSLQAKFEHYFLHTDRNNSVWSHLAKYITPFVSACFWLSTCLFLSVCFIICRCVGLLVSVCMFTSLCLFYNLKNSWLPQVSLSIKMSMGSGKAQQILKTSVLWRSSTQIQHHTAPLFNNSCKICIYSFLRQTGSFMCTVVHVHICICYCKNW